MRRPSNLCLNLLDFTPEWVRVEMLEIEKSTLCEIEGKILFCLLQIAEEEVGGIWAQKQHDLYPLCLR